MSQDNFYIYLTFINGESFKSQGSQIQLNRLEDFIQEEKGFIRFFNDDDSESNYKTRYLMKYIISPIDIEDYSDSEDYKKVRIGFMK